MASGSYLMFVQIGLSLAYYAVCGSTKNEKVNKTRILNVWLKFKVELDTYNRFIGNSTELFMQGTVPDWILPAYVYYLAHYFVSMWKSGIR